MRASRCTGRSAWVGAGRWRRFTRLSCKPWQLWVLVAMAFSESTLRAVALSLLGDPFYQAISVDAGDDTQARLNVLMPYFECSFDEAARLGVCVETPEVALNSRVSPNAVSCGSCAMQRCHLPGNPQAPSRNDSPVSF